MLRPASAAQAVPPPSTTPAQNSMFQSNTTHTNPWIQQTSSFAAPTTQGTNSTTSGTKPQHDEQAIREALAALAKLGLNVTAEDLGKLNPPDEYEDELALMAEVRAYFDVSYKVSSINFGCSMTGRTTQSFYTLNRTLVGLAHH